jgi:hypothetical protein
MKIRSIICLVIITSCASVALWGQKVAPLDGSYYRLEFENDQLRIFRLILAPNERTTLQQHPRGIEVFVTDAHLKYVFVNGAAQEVRAEPGQPRSFAPSKHSIENLSDQPVESVVIELKTTLPEEGEISRDEASAIASIRNIVTAQITFYSTKSRGTYGGLNELKEVRLLDEQLGGGVKSGYIFSVDGAGNPHNFVVIAMPIVHGVTGKRSFYADATAVIRYTKDGSVPNEKSVPLGKE